MTPTHHATMGFHENLEEAAALEVRDLLDLLEDERQFSRVEFCLRAMPWTSKSLRSWMAGKACTRCCRRAFS